MNAKTSAKEPNTSTATPHIPRRSRVSYIPLLHTSGFGSAGRSAAFSSRCCFILGSAFRLDNLGDKSSLRSGVTFHEGLRFVNKRVRQRVSANVSYRERSSLSLQHKINAALEVTNTSRRDGAADPHSLIHRGALQRL